MRRSRPRSPTRRARFVATGLALATLVGPHRARADAKRTRPQMPEPVLEESITDIDRDEAGELEADAIAGGTRSGDGVRRWQSSVEVEWAATRDLGVALESGASGHLGSEPRRRFEGIDTGVSWSLLHLRSHDLHLQAEATGHFFGGRVVEEDVAKEPGDVALPYGVGLRAGFRLDRWTLRAALGVELGAPSSYLPLRATMGLFTGFGRDERAGFFGLELGVDGGRGVPFFAALDLMAALSSIGLPMHVGIALPWTPALNDVPTSVGILGRLIVEAD